MTDTRSLGDVAISGALEQDLRQHLQKRRVVVDMRTTKGCFIYLRISTDKKKQETSLEVQEDICRKRAAALGLTVLGVFSDQRSRGVRRDGLRDLINQLEHREDVSALVAWRAERIWGHVEQQRLIMYQCKINGVRVYDNTTEYKNDTPQDALFNLVVAGLSEYETNTVSVRAYDHNAGKMVESGQVVTRPIYGWWVQKGLNENGRKIGDLRIYPDRMAIVRRIFRDYVSGIPAYQIAGNLNDEGERTDKGMEWIAQSVHRILDNEMYIGKMTWNKTRTDWVLDTITGDKVRTIVNVPPDKWLHGTIKQQGDDDPGIVCTLAEDYADPASVAEAVELWHQAKAKRDEGGRQRPSRKHPLRPLHGLVYCGRCGYQMDARPYYKTYKKEGVARKFDFRCRSTRNRNKGCTVSHVMSEAQLMRKLFAFAELRASERSTVVTWSRARPDENTLQAQIEKAQRDLEKAKRSKQRLLKMQIGGAFDDESDEFVAEQYALVKAEIDKAQEILETAEATSLMDTTEEVMPRETRLLVRDVIEILTDDEISLEDRRSLAYRTFQRITIDHPTVHFRLKQPTS